MSTRSNVELGRVALLDALRNAEKTWEVLAPRYGVTNPNPPWKTSLTATCDCLDASGPLPALDRRRAEDELVDSVYSDVPAPERQLLALVHIMLNRGLVSETDLARRMCAVRSRLESA
jgi:hypothetical protein